MTIRIPDSAKELIEQQAAKAGYADTGDYLVALVERDRNRALRDEIEAKLVEAVNAPSSPMTSSDWDDIRKQGRRILGRESGQ